LVGLCGGSHDFLEYAPFLLKVMPSIIAIFLQQGPPPMALPGFCSGSAC
jgi:hypothetical protein